MIGEARMTSDLVTRRYVVCIYVPIYEDDGTDGKGVRCRIGTGYPVGNDLVLTARHVVRPKDENGCGIRQTQYKIAVSWFSDPSKAITDLEREDNEAIIWEGDDAGEGLDAALLYCPYPIPVKFPGVVSQANLQGSAQLPWSGDGYPAAAKRRNVYEPGSCGGRIGPKVEHEELVQVFVNYGGPKAGEDWRGASGMPLFLEGTHQILGIAREHCAKYGGEKLLATPASRLLANEDFVRHIGAEEPDPHRDWFKRHLVALIQKYPTIRDAFVETSFVTSVQVSIQPAWAEILVENLLACRVDVALKAVRGAQKHLIEGRTCAPTREAGKAGEALRKAVNYLGPALFDRTAVAQVRTDMNDKTKVICRSVASLRTLCEIAFAAAEGRETQFVQRKECDAFPIGKRQLAAPPECGTDVAEPYAALQSALLRKHMPGGGDAVEGCIVGPIVKAILPSRDTSNNRTVNLIRTKNKINNLVEDGTRYYVLTTLPGDEADKITCETAISSIKKNLGDIMFMELIVDEQRETKEMNEFGVIPIIKP